MRGMTPCGAKTKTRPGCREMRKKFEKGDEEYMAFAEFYKLVQEYWIPEADDKYWGDIINACTKMMDKYKDNLFIKHMVLAYLDAKQEENQNVRLPLSRL